MRQKLGQHFLNDEEALQKIAAALDARKGEVIIEIGPGHGELTAEIVNQYPDAPIIVIEKDAELAEHLLEHLTEHVGATASAQPRVPKIEIIQGNALKELPKLVARLAGEHTLFRIIGNIPYYLTGHLLRMVSELDTLPKGMVLLMQKEVAERIVAQPPEMNRLAASVQYWAETEIVGIVGRDKFTPPPEVDSAIIRFARIDTGKKALGESAKDIAERETYYKTVRAVFQQPRKTLFNNLFAAVKAQDGMTGEKARAVIQARLDEEGIDPSLRPQDLGIEEIAKLSPLF